MLKELTKNEWLSLLNIPENRVPTVLVLRGTRNLKVNYAKHRTFFTDVFEVGSPNGIFEDVLIGTYKNIDVGYASVYGDAMASEVTHLYCLYRDSGGYYYMRQLYVDRTHRRKGIATRLLDWLYENVWTDKKVRLDVLAHNEDAVAFYKKYGFRIGVFRMEK